MRRCVLRARKQLASAALTVGPQNLEIAINQRILRGCKLSVERLLIILSQSLQLTVLVSHETRIRRNQTRKVKTDRVRNARVFSLKQTENCLISGTFIIKVDEAAQMSLIRRPIARCIVMFLEGDQNFFFDRTKTSALAEITYERQGAVSINLFASRLFFEEFVQRRQLITGRSFRSDAADSFNDGAVECRQQLLRFTGMSGVFGMGLRYQAAT